MNSMVKKSISVILLFLLCRCSSRKTNKIPARVREMKNLILVPTTVHPEYTIKIKREISFGSTKKVLIGGIGGIAVDDSGRVYITDAQKIIIDVFGPDGHYLTHIGRKGRGPGEFGYIMKPNIINNRLYVYDPVAFRMNIFSLDSLKLEHTVNLDLSNQNKISGLRSYSVHYMYPINNGNYLVKFGPAVIKQNPQNGNKMNIKFYFMNKMGKIIPHQILKQKDYAVLTAKVDGRIRSAAFSFMGLSLDAISSAGSIYSAWSKDFLIKKYDTNGNYKYAIYCPYKKVRLTRDAARKSIVVRSRKVSDQDDFIKLLQDIMDQNNLPKTWPALAKLKIDDQNRLWVATVVKNMNVYQWWVLNTNGKLIARFNWTRNKPIEVIKKGYIYTRETDTTTGFQKIVRYRIEMKPSKK